METATHIIIFIVALAFSAGFLALVIVLVPAIRELRALLSDLRMTSSEVRDLTEELNRISSGIGGRIEGIGGVLSKSQKISSNVRMALNLASKLPLAKAEWLALVPAIMWGWKAVSRLKRRKNERPQ
jgi:predicted PurR-regulated permease PerM